MFASEPEMYGISSFSTWYYVLVGNVIGFVVIFIAVAITLLCFRACGVYGPIDLRGYVFVAGFFFMIQNAVVLITTVPTTIPSANDWVPMKCQVAATGIAGIRRKSIDGPTDDADECSPHTFKGFSGITCEDSWKLETRHWSNVTLPCAPLSWDDGMSWCDYNVWAVVSVNGYHSHCAYDGFTAVTKSSYSVDMSNMFFFKDWRSACEMRAALIGSTQTCWIQRHSEQISITKDLPKVARHLSSHRAFLIRSSTIGFVIGVALTWDAFWKQYCECVCDMFKRRAHAREPPLLG
eukprot:gnl/TRDRNA2_/TRDRNA2_150244_c0_seq1.p1 gnl/TRDRNA2_/TRDRNA2_150244_c0~~gnl/TRDRNA2_/TRDRNA2_150244_c0_seq1.p1  ORF type:complete len:293 (+),score=0.16 gnl/TRDRNA2_/TRDRNA2_150244_c0_seq1:109-987(+)